MWWQVHKVPSAQRHGLGWVAAVRGPRSHILDKVSLCKNRGNSTNKASGRCLRLRTLISSMRWFRPVWIVVHCVRVSQLSCLWARVRQSFLLLCFRSPLCGHCWQVLVWARHIMESQTRMMSYQSFEEMLPWECLLLFGKSCTESMALNVHAVSCLKSSFTGCLGKMESADLGQTCCNAWLVAGRTHWWHYRLVWRRKRQMVRGGMVGAQNPWILFLFQDGDLTGTMCSSQGMTLKPMTGILMGLWNWASVSLNYTLRFCLRCLICPFFVPFWLHYWVSLPHWPAAARWWHSRLKLIGPHREKTELLLLPNSESTGLHQVHSTWAGTFVLAALVAMFPGINFVLLDSDCLPITLFEVEDLWTEAYLARFPVHSNCGIPRAHSLRAFKRFCNDPKVVDTQQQVGSTRMEQEALVVAKPHAEFNAGLIVIFRSSHPPIFNWNAWSLRLRSSSGTETDGVFKDEASTLTYAFWDRIEEFLQRSLTDNELSSEEKAQCSEFNQSWQFHLSWARVYNTPWIFA